MFWKKLNVWLALIKVVVWVVNYQKWQSIYIGVYCENIVIKIYTNFNLNILIKLFFPLSKKIIFFSPILVNNNLPLKIYCKNIVIIDTDFNLNVLLQLFFSLSKKNIFFSPILANDNLPLKIYCESIVKILW